MIQKDGRMEITWSESLKVFEDSYLLLCLLISVKLIIPFAIYLGPGDPQEQTRRVTGVCVGRVNS